MVSEYQQLFGRNPTWQELFYWTNVIRSNPRSNAWQSQLASTQNGQIPYETGQFGLHGGSGGSGSGSSMAASKGRAAHVSHAVAVHHSTARVARSTTQTASRSGGAASAALVHAKVQVSHVDYRIGVLPKSSSNAKH